MATVGDMLGTGIILFVFAWIMLGIYSGIKKQSIDATIEEIKDWAKNKPEEVKENMSEHIKILP